MARATGQGGRDSPDFFLISNPFEQTINIDNTELSVRLGSLMGLHRSGMLIWSEGFNYGLSGWSTDTSTAGCEPYLSGDYFFARPFSCKLYTIGGVLDTSDMWKNIPFIYTDMIAIEIPFWATDDWSEFYVWMQIFDGDTNYNAGVRILGVTGEIQLVNDDGDWETFLTYDWGEGKYDTWHIFKLFVDLENSTYSKCLFSRENIDLTAYPLYTLDADSKSYMNVDIRLVSVEGDTESIYVDNIVVTYE